MAALRRQYGCGPVEFTGTANALYDRHLVFDHAVPLEAASAREHFEALATSLRDVLTQRWLKTQDLHERNNVKRVYYLSMEFLLDRTLALIGGSRYWQRWRSETWRNSTPSSSERDRRDPRSPPV